jgi:PAS domain S-box-containing protein
VTPRSGRRTLGALIGALVTRLGSAEEELRRSEARLAEAQRIAHVGSWDWDVRGDRITWSAELHRIYGLQPGSVDLSYDAYLSRVHPDDRDRVDGIVRSAFETHLPFAFSHRAIRSDGTIRVLDSRGHVVAEDGVIVRMAGTAHDVTERAEVEEQLAVSAELRRRAVELNDTVVQSLAVAHYRLVRGDPDAAEAVRAALESAKELVRDLLGDDVHAPGSLRRETPAGAAFTPFGE